LTCIGTLKLHQEAAERAQNLITLNNLPAGRRAIPGEFLELSPTSTILTGRWSHYGVVATTTVPAPIGARMLSSAYVETHGELEESP